MAGQDATDFGKTLFRKTFYSPWTIRSRHDKVYQAHRPGLILCSSSPHPGQVIAIQPSASLHPTTPIGKVFADGPMEILVTRVWGQQVSLGISAHPELVIDRGEREGIVPWRGDVGED